MYIYIYIYIYIYVIYIFCVLLYNLMISHCISTNVSMVKKKHTARGHSH